jgi:hypothetical protein
MPRVLEKTKNRAGAERSCGRCGKVIQPGERYLSWSFRYGGTYYRCIEHPPKPSDLTQSKMSGVYAAIESAEVDLPKTEMDELDDLIHGVGETAQEVADEYREAAEPFGGEGENAERADELEGFADELLSFYAEDTGFETIEDARQAAEEALGTCPL